MLTGAQDRWTKNTGKTEKTMDSGLVCHAGLRQQLEQSRWAVLPYRLLSVSPPPLQEVARSALAQRQAPIPTAVRRNHPLPHACRALARRQAPSQRAYFRGVIAPLFASFASEKRGDPSSPRLRRDKVDLHGDRLSRRSVTKPEAASAARLARASENAPPIICNAANRSSIDLSPRRGY